MEKLEPGQEILASHIQELLTDVKNGDFGDFSSKVHDLPKMALMKRLDIIRKNLIEGDYD